MPLPKLRPRFSVRTLLILVTLVAIYFGCWEATKQEARRTSGLSRTLVSSPAPFIILREWSMFPEWRSGYYLWLGNRQHFLWDFEDDMPVVPAQQRWRPAWTQVAPVAAAASQSDDPMVRLKKLKDMLDMELITQQDFDQRKAEILAEM